MLNSRILITPLNGPNTELAKNLILAGVNVTIYDNQIVTEDDFETNFLVALEDIGKSRGEVIFQKLKNMNPNGDNQWVEGRLLSDELDANFLSKFTVVCTSFTTFRIMEKWDQASKQANVPYYNIVPVGPYSFCYVSLGN